MAHIISPVQEEIGPLFTVDFRSIRLTAAQFQQLCGDNRDLRLELTSEGELIVMPPRWVKNWSTQLSSNSAAWALG
jgi:Uma2 family endonuclease